MNRILKDIDNEESYYVGTNGCLYQDLDKEELLAIKQEIENLHSIIKEVREYIENPRNEMSVNTYQELLEILDKVGETDVKD